MTEIDFALQQKKDTDIIEFLGTIVWNKLNEFKKLENLSFSEQNFIYVDIFEGEINHDGFYGFFLQYFWRIFSRDFRGFQYY